MLARTLYLTSGLFLSQALVAQMVLQAGTELQVTSGTTVQILGTTTWNIQGGSTFINDGSVQLGPATVLQEASGSPIKGSGTERVSQDHVSSLNQVDPGGLGLTITSSATDSLRVTRGHLPYSDTGGNEGIMRWYAVDPETNTGLNATLELRYDDTELNGIWETGLVLVRSDDGGNSWNVMSGATLDVMQNTMTVSGVNDLTRFTLFVDPAQVSVNEVENNATPVRLFPSIATDRITLITTGKFSDGNLLITNTSGQVVTVHTQQRGRSMNIDVSGLAAGVYQVVTEERHVVPFMKQ